MGIQKDATKILNDCNRWFTKIFGKTITKKKLKKQGKTLTNWFKTEMKK